MGRRTIFTACLALGLGTTLWVLGAADSKVPGFGTARISFGDKESPPASLASAGFSVVAADAGPQLALLQRSAFLVSLQAKEDVRIAIPCLGVTGPLTVSAEVASRDGGEVEAGLALGEGTARMSAVGAAWTRIEATIDRAGPAVALHIHGRALSGSPVLRFRGLRMTEGGRSVEVAVNPPRADANKLPLPGLPDLRPPIEQALIEWDWRMQDGIGTERAPSTYAAAIEQTLRRGDSLLADLREAGVPVGTESGQWAGLRKSQQELAGRPQTTEAEWEDLWRQVHLLRRRIVFRNPLADTGPILFAKQCPGSFSHQLTQNMGRFARPGGGIFVLDEPGRSLRSRKLAAGSLPMGSCQQPEVSWDGRRVLFSFCAVAKSPRSWNDHCDHHYHLYEMAADGSNLRQLTDGDYNDFAPKYLPNGQIVFISTRRGGWHRCGGRPGEGCENFTLALANADGSQPRPISFHETQEWDPSVLDDGRLLFTRWDYVDRHAVFYQQLFTARADGTAPASFYGNNTFNPVGTWEARQVPGSRQVMATAGAHHAMTAGSIIRIDTSKAIDGPAAITRLTPDALFPESETRVAPTGWHAPVGVPRPPTLPVEAQRWPGHCYRSAYPLSEKYFLAAYSFDSLIGEPAANPVNMFGLYLVDAFGNKELLHRDLNIASLWPVPLRARPRPPLLQSVADQPEQPEGKFFVQDVHESEPSLPPGSVKRLRILQVLPKSTTGINSPRVGLANASPGKQVLGTVPVEPDGSAYFRAPAGIPLAFQALDQQGQAVQVMRSVTYLQPGEVRSCVGCHERRTTAPPPAGAALALLRPASAIQPGPEGSRPLSFPILVQPVLDKHCVRCHNAEKPEGKVVLTGEPQGAFTASYNALAPRVSYSSWGGKGGDFRITNSEPMSQPGFFGARGSSLMKLLEKGHHQVKLMEVERERLITWMDANALFYGSFDPRDQARQQRGERIAGPNHQ